MPPRNRARGVPKISEIRTKLGFGNSRNPPAQKACKTFLEEEYEPTIELPVYYFTNWRDGVHRNELLLMAEMFLIDLHGGTEFWPADGSSSNRPRWGVNTETNNT